MRKAINNSIFALLTIFSVLVLANMAQAQPDWARRGRYTRGDVDQLIKRVEDRTDRFVKQFDRALDNSRLNGSQREDNLNQRARDLEAATDELRREFNGNRNWWETRSNAQKCLSVAADINAAMRNRRFNRATENNWKNLRQELNALARAYDLPAMGAYR